MLSVGGDSGTLAEKRVSSLVFSVPSSFLTPALSATSANTYGVMSDSCNSMDCRPPGFSFHGIFPGKNTGVGCHSLLQGIFPTQGMNPGLLKADSLSSESPGKTFHIFSSVQFSHSVVSDSSRPHELQHTRPPCPSSTPGVHSNSRPSSW